MKKLLLVSLCIVSGMANAQSWLGCIPDSIGPDGCGTTSSGADPLVGPDDVVPSIGPWGHRFRLMDPGYILDPGYGLSTGSSGDQYVDPGDGQDFYPDRRQELYPDRRQELYPDRRQERDPGIPRSYESGTDRR
jgi:hypothetical protein